MGVGGGWKEEEKRGKQVSFLPLTQFCPLMGDRGRWLVPLYWWLDCDKVG